MSLREDRIEMEKDRQDRRGGRDERLCLAGSPKYGASEPCNRERVVRVIQGRRGTRSAKGRA